MADAKASANLYSLIETAKANKIETYHYLRKVFIELPEANSLEDIEALLPFEIKAAYDETSQIKTYRFLIRLSGKFTNVFRRNTRAWK